MENPVNILEELYKRAEKHTDKPFIKNKNTLEKTVFVARNIQNRAGCRLLLANLLAVVHNAGLDVRKPYTEIGTEDSFSGRHYDEAYITCFISRYNLPCNQTTAFLTPALRNRNNVLTPDMNLVGRPPEVYQYVLDLFDLIYRKVLRPKDLLLEVIRQLILFRNESQERIKSLLNNLEKSGSVPLSSEDIVSLIKQHMDCRGSSRLPVLIVAAAYNTIGNYIKEKTLPLESHNAADRQTGSLGDLQIIVRNDDNVVTGYEMKKKKVTIDDVDIALQKIATHKENIDNYIFITTEEIDDSVQDYCRSLYEQTGGIELVILDCISFLRHFLHLFHRFRLQYITEYQKLLLNEPDSAVSKPLKEAFLALRQTAESSYP